MAPLPLRVVATGSDSDLPLMFDLGDGDSDGTLRKYKDQCRAELSGKTLKELAEIRQNAEESMHRGIQRYQAAYAASQQKIQEENCGAPGRLAALKRDLRNWKLLLDGADQEDFEKMNAKLHGDRETLQQLVEQADLKTFSKEQREGRLQTLARQIQGIENKIADVLRKIEVCKKVDGQILPAIRSEEEFLSMSENEQQSPADASCW